jgi:peptidylglycine monooxygenase
VADWGNNRVQRLDGQGRFVASWGAPGRGPGELATPWDVAVAPDGRVLVADYGNHRVQVVPAGRLGG